MTREVRAYAFEMGFSSLLAHGIIHVSPSHYPVGNQVITPPLSLVKLASHSPWLFTVPLDVLCSFLFPQRLVRPSYTRTMDTACFSNSLSTCCGW